MMDGDEADVAVRAGADTEARDDDGRTPTARRAYLGEPDALQARLPP